MQQPRAVSRRNRGVRRGSRGFPARRRAQAGTTNPACRRVEQSGILSRPPPHGAAASAALPAPTGAAAGRQPRRVRRCSAALLARPGQVAASWVARPSRRDRHRPPAHRQPVRHSRPPRQSGRPSRPPRARPRPPINRRKPIRNRRRRRCPRNVQPRPPSPGSPPPLVPSRRSRKRNPPRAPERRPAPPAEPRGASEPSGTTSRPSSPTPKPTASQPSAPARPQPATRPKPVRPERFAWAFPEEPPPEEQATPLRNAPAVDAAGRIFMYANDRLYGLAVDDGKPKIVWEYVTGNRIPGPIIVGPDGSIRMHCGDSCLHCLEGAAGKQLWVPACVGDPLGYAAPVVDQEGNTWICAAGGGLVKVDARGRVQKPVYFRSRQKFDSPGIIARGVLYIGSEDGYVFAIDLGEDRGTNRWNHAAEQGYVGWRSLGPRHHRRRRPDRGRPGRASLRLRLRARPPSAPPCPANCSARPCLTGSATSTWASASRRAARRARGPGVRRRQQPQGPLGVPRRRPGRIDPGDRRRRHDLLRRQRGRDPRDQLSGPPEWTAEVGSPIRSAGTILAPGRLAFGLDNETLVVLECSSQGLAAAVGRRSAARSGQCGLA